MRKNKKGQWEGCVDLVDDLSYRGVDLLVMVEIDGALLLRRELSSSNTRWGEDVGEEALSREVAVGILSRSSTSLIPTLAPG
jgi:hypothetical protein